MIAAAFYPKDVILRMSDFKTNEYSHLKGGEQYEPVEPNPMLGYRGAYRYIHDPDVFDLELKAIKTEPRGSKTVEQLYAAERKRIEEAIPKGTRVVALDSAKQAHYLPAILGVQAWFGTTSQCIDAACTGRWA